MKIVIDANGGDYAPKEIVKGCLKALKEYKNLDIVLTGKKDEIFEALKDKNAEDKKNITIIDCSEVITNDESPTVAIRQKTDSSLVKAFDILKNDDDCIGIISAGSTGAVLTGSVLKIGRIKGVSRPALAPLLPTKKGGQVLLIDAGANVDCKPINLCHFAIIGSEYMKAFLNIKNPRVALLNVGTEDKKGNDLCHQTFPLLKELPINFVGNMEAREVLSGDFDVIVTDGFAGNVFLKSTEGAISLVMSEIKQNVKKGFFSKIGASFMFKTFQNLKKKLDYNRYGGSAFLGIKKTVVKAHGSSKSKAFFASIKQIIELDNSHFNSIIEDKMQTTIFPKIDE